MLPEVEVIELGGDPKHKLNRLLNSSAFDALRISTEDQLRAGAYHAEQARQQQRTSAASVETFLASLDLRLTIAPLNDITLPRAHQLLGKTNQFNLTLRRPAEAELREYQHQFITAALADRFGDYGIVGVVQLTPQQGCTHIEDFALSCRALGRGVEQALLAYAVGMARIQGDNVLRAKFILGPRNQQVAECRATSPKLSLIE